jgi:polyhydroxybutyrate depolymerase
MTVAPLAPRRIALCGAALVVLGLASGCRASSASTLAPATSLAAAACAESVSTGDHTVSILSGGMSRNMLVHIPTGYTDRTPVALILNLHGSGSSAAGEEGFSGMNRAADADGFIVAYPQGAIPSGSGYDWNVPGQPLFGGASPPPNAPDDVTFLAQTIRTLEKGLCVDANRVFATGFSGGARMTSQLGCDLSTTVAAIAPVSGLRLPTPCAAARSVPVISFHGTDDPIDPYTGNGQAYWTYSVPAAAQRWAEHDACSSAAAATHPAPNVMLTEYSGCAAGTSVELYTISGEGHEWPGGPRLPAGDTRVLGPQSNVIDADTLMWQFFDAHPLPVS